MADTGTGAHTVGSLLVANGRQHGTVIPLRLPVTLIGSAAECDIRLTGHGVVPVHCCIVVTPAGPVVRSLAPEATRVNDAPTAAQVLTHGDELWVGPCAFRMQWPVSADDEAILLTPARGENDPPVEFALREREATLGEQEHQLAELLTERHIQIQGLLDQLAEGRDQLRQDHEAMKGEREEAAQHLQRAKALVEAREHDRKRSRQAAARYLRHGRHKQRVLERKLKDQLAACEQERAELLAAQARLQEEAEGTSTRLHQGWAALSEAQRQHQAEVQAQEQELSRLFQMLEQRAELLAHQRKTLGEDEGRILADRRTLEVEVRVLREEVQGLERRAEHLRETIAEREAQRNAFGLPEGGFVPEALPISGGVPLVNTQRSAEELLTLLHYREAELDRDQDALRKVRAELDRRQEMLEDRQRVLDDQAEQIEAMRDEWRRNEGRTVAELEQLATELTQREQSLAEKDAQMRSTALALKQVKDRLDDWQTSLTRHESKSIAAREQAETDLQRRQSLLSEREQELATIAQTWNHLRDHERTLMQGEWGQWSEARQSCLAERSARDLERESLHAELGRLAGLVLGLEQAKLDWSKTATFRAKRRLRVLQRRWEGHFRRYAADLSRRRQGLDQEIRNLETRYTTLQQSLREVMEATAQLARERETLDMQRLGQRVEPHEPEPILLSLAEARRQRNVRSAQSAALQALDQAQRDTRPREQAVPMLADVA